MMRFYLESLDNDPFFLFEGVVCYKRSIATNGKALSPLMAHLGHDRHRP